MNGPNVIAAGPSTVVLVLPLKVTNTTVQVYCMFVSCAVFLRLNGRQRIIWVVWEPESDEK